MIGPVVRGLWPGVVGIVGNAEVLCLPCADKAYGERAVATVVDGDIDGYAVDEDSSDYPRDNEGNALGVMFANSEDAQGQYCGNCREPLFDRDDYPDTADYDTELGVFAVIEETEE